MTKNFDALINITCFNIYFYLLCVNELEILSLK